MSSTAEIQSLTETTVHLPSRLARPESSTCALRAHDQRRFRIAFTVSLTILTALFIGGIVAFS